MYSIVVRVVINMNELTRIEKVRAAFVGGWMVLLI